MRVPSTHVGEGDLEADVRLDQLGDLAQMLTKRGPRVLRAVARDVLLRIGGLEDLHRLEHVAASGVDHVGRPRAIQRLEPLRL